MKTETKRWYGQDNKNGQGLIGDEKTGRNVAVCYDAADVDLIAAAPDLLEALKAFLRAPHSGSSGPGYSTIEVTDFNLRAAKAAIAKAKGE